MSHSNSLRFRFWTLTLQSLERMANWVAMRAARACRCDSCQMHEVAILLAKRRAKLAGKKRSDSRPS